MPYRIRPTCRTSQTGSDPCATKAFLNWLWPEDVSKNSNSSYRWKMYNRDSSSNRSTNIDWIPRVLKFFETEYYFFHTSPSRWCLNYISFIEWNLIRLPGQQRVCDHNEVFLPGGGKCHPKINKIRAPTSHWSIFFGDKMWRSKCQPDSGHQGSQRWEEIPNVQIAPFQFPLIHSEPVWIIDRITISVEESQNYLIYVERQEHKESTLSYKGSPLHRIYVPVQLQPSISLCVVCNCFDQNMKSQG